MNKIWQKLSNEKLSNQEIYAFYKKELENTPELRNYQILVGTNDSTGLSFLTNFNELFDFQLEELNIASPLQHKHMFYLSNEFKDKYSLDLLLNIDSNATNYFNNFFKDRNKEHKFIDMLIEKDIDIDYAPYLLEDSYNPFHTKLNYAKTKEKLIYLEKFRFLNHEKYLDNKKIEIDLMKLKMQTGFNDFDEYIKQKELFWIFSCDEKEQKIILSDNKTYTYNLNCKLFDYFESLYILTYSYILNALIEAFYSKKSLEEKILSICKNMKNNGPILLNVLYFIYLFFRDLENSTSLTREFFNFDVNWKAERILKEARNKAWDIFLYETFVRIGFGQKPMKNADLCYPFFVTKDKRFYNAYIKNVRSKLIMIGSNKEITNALESNEISLNFHNLLLNKNVHLRRNIQLNRNDCRYSLAKIFMDQMEEQIKRIF